MERARRDQRVCNGSALVFYVEVNDLEDVNTHETNRVDHGAAGKRRRESREQFDVVNEPGDFDCPNARPRIEGRTTGKAGRCPAFRPRPPGEVDHALEPSKKTVEPAAGIEATTC